MGRSIQVSDETYTLLQEFAQPFEDTPGDVILKCLSWIAAELDERGMEVSWKALVRPDNEREETKADKLLPYGMVEESGKRTPQRAFEKPILGLLAQAGGRATPDHIAEQMPKLVNLTKTDWDPHRTQKYRWVNNMHWQRLRMKYDGLIRDDSAIGVWELTDAGWKAAKAVKS